jgi:hypothetical protein
MRITVCLSIGQFAVVLEFSETAILYELGEVVVGLGPLEVVNNDPPAFICAGCEREGSQQQRDVHDSVACWPK